MRDPFPALPSKAGLFFGLPPLVLALCCHALQPQRTGLVFAILVLVEIFFVLPLFFHFAPHSRTGMELMAVPGMVIGVLAANLLAIPIARRLRSLFNASARQ